MVNDGAADSNTAVATIAINLVPTAVDDQAITPLNTPVITGNVLANDDPGNAPITITGFSAVSAHGGLSPTMATAHSPMRQAGNDTFTYTIADIDGDRSTGTVTVQVGQNHAPTDLALLASQPVKENVAGAVVGTLSVSDPDPGDTYTYTLGDARFQVVGNPLKLKDGIRLDYEREQQVTMNVTATDHGGLSVTKPVTVSVDDVAEARFAVLGDFGAGVGSQAVADLIGRMGVDFVVTVGDNSYGTTVPIDDQIGRYYSNYIGNYTGAYGSGSAINRFFPTLGNHDYDDLGINAYLNYFTLPGNEHFFIVDSEDNEPDGNSVNSVQAQWLHAGLASSDSDYNIVVFHEPSYSSGVHGPDTRMQWPFEALGRHGRFQWPRPRL